MTAACVDYLGQLRWPDGFVCPACGKDRYWRTGKALFMCAACGRKTSVTAGTIFHRSHTPLSTWFAAIWLKFFNTVTGSSCFNMAFITHFCRIIRS